MDLMAETSTHSLWQRWCQQIGVLTKARLTSMVLITTVAGFYLGSRGATNYWQLLCTLVGTGMVASAASALNQLMEREWDSKMKRTAERPLPTGRLHPDEVLIFAFVAAVGGMIFLTLAVNFLAGLVAAVTLASYLFIYTPLKRYSTLNTVVGAIPGALPPVLGWVAANSKFTVESLVLFAIVFFWQMPHFLAIAWRCRHDYADAGFKMLPITDPSGASSGRQAVLYASALLPISLWPTFLHLAGAVYFYGALLLGMMFLWTAWKFLLCRDDITSRRLFLASIIYLPVLLLLMTLDMT